MELYLLMLVAGVICGGLTILFGFGGGFVVVPLVYASIRYTYAAESQATAVAFKSAVATSLLLMIINAGWASYQQLRQGNIARDYLFPMAYWVAIGAMTGTYITLYLSAAVLRWAFVIYLLITIGEYIFRKLRPMSSTVLDQARALSRSEQYVAGWIIGHVAAALGVGGSVMTVPLFRRCGLDMRRAVALANPLSIVVALLGCASYILAYLYQPIDLGVDFIGYFYIPAMICLALGSFVGMRIALPWVSRIPNHLHEWGYVILLSMVLLLVICS